MSSDITLYILPPGDLNLRKIDERRLNENDEIITGLKTYNYSRRMENNVKIM